MSQMGPIAPVRSFTAGRRNWGEADPGIRGLAKDFLAMIAADGVFARQMKASPREAFPPKLFGLDVLVDADGKP